jgi:hypothetical protein
MHVHRCAPATCAGQPHSWAGQLCCPGLSPGHDAAGRAPPGPLQLHLQRHKLGLGGVEGLGGGGQLALHAVHLQHAHTTHDVAPRASVCPCAPARAAARVAHACARAVVVYDTQCSYLRRERVVRIRGLVQLLCERLQFPLGRVAQLRGVGTTDRRTYHLDQAVLRRVCHPGPRGVAGDRQACQPQPLTTAGPPAA